MLKLGQFGLQCFQAGFINWPRHNTPTNWHHVSLFLSIDLCLRLPMRSLEQLHFGSCCTWAPYCTASFCKAKQMAEIISFVLHRHYNQQTAVNATFRLYRGHTVSISKAFSSPELRWLSTWMVKRAARYTIIRRFFKISNKLRCSSVWVQICRWCDVHASLPTNSNLG